MPPRRSNPFSALAGDFRFALGFLTRIRFPGTPAPDFPGLASTMRAFPLVGALVGLIGGIVYLAASPVLPTLGAAALALAATAIVTGALHEDGLADLADGFGGGTDKDSKLAIMRDSRIGSYGVLALLLTVLLRASTLSGLNAETGFWVLIGVHSASRAAIPALVATMRPARTDGLGASAGVPSRETVLWSVMLAAGILLLTLPFETALLVLAGTALAFAAVGLLARRQIDGFTGDVLGAAEQVAETLALVLVAGTA